jgi:replicative superfamily II helicase
MRKASLCCQRSVILDAICSALQQPIAAVRFIAVSATIPNVADIADWLAAPPEGLKVRQAAYMLGCAAFGRHCQ